MKNVKRILFGLAALLAVAGGAVAQDYSNDAQWGQWGATPEERKENILIYQYFKDAGDMKNYDVALANMYILIEKAPKSHVNIYVRGGNIYKTKITQATSMPERTALVDSLMWLYDKRVEAFGDDPERGKAYILAQKAADYLAYRQMDREGIHKLYNEAIEATGGKDPVLINTYFNILVEDYKMDMLETDFMLDEYDRLSALYDANPTPEMEEGRNVLDNLFIPLADCENLLKIYQPRYEADPNNVELMTKIVGMLGRAKCEGEFQLTVAENLYKVAPTPETGLALATIFEARSDYEKSLFYWQESINNELDPAKKATYTMRAATSALGTNNYRQAITFARATLEIEPDNGLAYMIIGQSYGMLAPGSCSDAFERRAAYWIVVDTLQKARSLLSGDSAQTEALTRQINQYSANFPSQEECFFRSLKNGDSYNVNCGMVSGRTTVREGR